MRKLRFHLLDLPHRPNNREHSTCAYGTKVWLFAKMMTSLGHEVYYYGPEGGNVPATECINTITTDQINLLCNNDNYKQEMYKIEWTPDKPYWQISNSNAAIEIRKRYQERDFVCVVGGWCQQPCTNLLSDLKVHVVEPWVGYSGIYSRFICTESYAHMHRLLGARSSDPNGDYYWAKIPIYLDPDEFPKYEVNTKDPYLLFLGRAIRRKGIQQAVDTAKALNKKLIVAGQGVKSCKDGVLVGDEATYYYDKIEYVGSVNPQERAKLMGEAEAFFCPTEYIEPGGNTCPEAQAAGCPVLTNPWGCFTEQVSHSVTGFLCSSHNEFCWAAEHGIKTLNRDLIRKRAFKLFGIDNVKYAYQAYFEQLDDLWGEGYYKRRPIETLGYRRTEYNWDE